MGNVYVLAEVELDGRSGGLGSEVDEDFSSESERSEIRLYG